MHILDKVSTILGYVQKVNDETKVTVFINFETLAVQSSIDLELNIVKKLHTTTNSF
jgi:hypothetical protein